MAHATIRSKVFYAIRHHDIELAENFAARCPEVEDIVDLNTFFHHTLSRYAVDTTEQRQCLDDSMSMEDWLRHFEATVLPFLRRHRFPPNTGSKPSSPYMEQPRV